ncbi:hypothetical protein [Tardiphaga sp. P9-11]|uniref:hypothetical protein n=1 Tax=Tardiphaga sp. P9-11 TaxID=2024614 RepID=UPI001FEDAF10|nr:hypothetical protein [Tardiphaga sp. P9-11]
MSGAPKTETGWHCALRSPLMAPSQKHDLYQRGAAISQTRCFIAVVEPEKDPRMPSHFHAVVWIDHLEARIFHVGLTGNSEIILHAHPSTRHIHHRANTIGSGHAAPDRDFFAQVMAAVSDAGEILIMGPSTAKLELATFIRTQDPQIAARIVAVEASDHPSDGEIIACAKRHFGIMPARDGNVHRCSAV